MRRFVTGASLALLVWGLSAHTASAEQSTEQPQRRFLSLDDLFALRTVSDPQISPDGRSIAYTVESADADEDESRSRIWLIETRGGGPIPMTIEGESSSSPRFSPDGRYLAFLSGRDDQPSQVYLLDLRGGEAQHVTEIIQGVRAYEWAPDGQRMVLVVQDPTELEKKAAEEGEPKVDPEATRPPWEIDRLQFKVDNVGYLDRRRTHLYVLETDTRNLRQLTSGDFDDEHPVWSPDGRQVAFASNRTADPDRNYDTDIWLVDVPVDDVPVDHDLGDDVMPTPRQLTTFPGTDDFPSFSPDGRTIAYLTWPLASAHPFSISRLAVVLASGGDPRHLLEDLDRSVSAPRFSPDGRSIFVIVEDSGAFQLGQVDLKRNRLTRLTSSDRAVSEFSTSRGSQIALSISDPASPAEVHLLGNGKLKQLTFENAEWMNAVALSEVEKVRFLSSDGVEIEGFIYKPPDYLPGRTYPTLLLIHGGPIAQYALEFAFNAQLYAANGYVVVMTNPRGSSGYGQDFSMAIFADWGNKDADDVLAGVDHAIGLGYADPARLGVAGWSYGGILTNHLITRTDRFKAAVSGASLGVYLANYGHDQYQRWYEQEFGLPWENRDVWERLSSYNRVDRITTPTLWMGGAQDWNVPIMNSEQMYIALKRRGVETKLVVYPGEHHSIKTPSYRRHLYAEHLAWFDRFVR
jgi:dipeptidyl aminopeptidase/acylaminoacyl peptidase